jgi:hypothetical protein
MVKWIGGGAKHHGVAAVLFAKIDTAFDLISDTLPFSRLWYLEVRQSHRNLARHQSPWPESIEQFD